MALLKNIKYANGTETNYHKIGEIRAIPLPDEIILVPKEDVVSVDEGVEMETPIEETGAATEGTPEGTETEPDFPEGEPEVPEVEYEEKVVKMYSIMTQILSYVSQEVRDTGMSNYLTSQINYFNITMNDLVSSDIMTICYNLIKTLPEFEEAENI
jgi:hypothetical protein